MVKTDYLKKSKAQKTAAWILLGGGAGLASAGMAVGMNQAVDDIANIFSGEEQETSNTGEILFYSGLVSMAGSIPLFIASGKNKRKGMSLSFKNEPVPLIQKNSFVNQTVPSLGLKISL